jgi:HEAT repeat protein
MTRRWWPATALGFVLLLSSPALGAGPAPLSNVEGALSQLAKDLADQSLPLAQRVEILRALGGWGGERVRPTLLSTLKDPAPELRALAARGLGWPGNREAVPALRELIEAPGEPAMVKGAAVEALGLIADRANRPLVVAATKHPEAAVRQAALWGVALGPLTDPQDRVTYLIQLAADQALPGLLRCDAVRELSTVNEDRVVEAFKRIIENEPRFAVAPPDAGGNPQQIMELRRIQARDVSAWVAEGLGLLKAKSAVPILVATAEDKSDFFLRLMSMRALIVLAAPEAVAVFTRRLEDPVADVRILALVGLSNLGDRSVVQPVQRRLTDPSPLVRAQAATTLATIGDRSVRPVLADLLKRETEATVQTALEEAILHLSR